MKVFFDGKILTSQMPGGINREVSELLLAFNKNKDIEKIYYRGLFWGQSPLEKKWFKSYYRLKVPVFLNQRVFNFLDNLGAEIFYKKNICSCPDLIYHSFYYRVPKNKKGPIVVDVHDMINELFIKNPKVKEYKKRAFFSADLIVSNSEATKKDLCKLYPINPEKVIVAYRGVSEAFLKKNNSLPVMPEKKHPYMLYVGARYSYKNFDFLLDVFINRRYFLDFDLILMGGAKELTFQQKEKIKNTPGQGSWLKQEFGSDEKLADLYSNALVFIYPSLYEGFGVPLIEAMACKCPVIASDTSCFPEIVGDSALLFDPKDPNDLAQKIERIINNKSVAIDLVEKGKIRVNQFSWDKTADIIYQGYLKLL